MERAAMARIAYIRVSTVGQNLEAQREAVLAAGAKRVFEEKASGKDRNRPELKACLAFLREGDELVVARLDRFAHSNTDLHAMMAELQARGVRVRFLDNPSLNMYTAHGEFLIAILAACAALERRLILSRTAEGRDVAKKKGVKFGRPAKVNRKLRAQVEALKSEGTSMGAIARRLGVGRATAYRAIANPNSKLSRSTKNLNQ